MITMSIDEITKKDFQAYERVRRGGRYNMLTHIKQAARLADLSCKKYIAILKDYEKLMKKWPEVRQL